MVKIEQIKSILCYYIIFYMLNKNLWDFLSGSILKDIYYSIIILCGIFGILKMLISKNHKYKTIAFMFLIYVVVIFVNGIFLANQNQKSVGYKEYLLYPLVCFAIIALSNKSISFRKMSLILLGWAVITSILALYEYIVKSPILPTSSTKITIYYDGTSSYRASVFIGSPMILAILLAIILVIAFYYYHFKKKKKYIIYIFVIIIGILVTGSRAPLVSAVAGILMMYYQIGKHHMMSSKTTSKILALFFVSILFILFITVVPDFKTGLSFVDNVISRFSSVFNFHSEWGNLERLLRWQYYIGIFIQHPFCGIGIATTSAEVLSNVNVTAHGITTESGVLARLVETGIVGAFPYYLFLVNCILLGLKNTKKKLPINCNFFYIVCGVVCVYLVEDIVLQISLDIFGQFIIFLILGLSMSNKVNFTNDKFLR